MVFKIKMSITQKIGQLTRSEANLIKIVKILHQNLLDAQKNSEDMYLLAMDLTAKQIMVIHKVMLETVGKGSRRETRYGIPDSFYMRHLVW